MSDIPPPTIPPPPEGVSDEAFLLAFLEHHEASCPACGYNAHKLREPRCPECGITLVLRPVSPQRISKSWVVLLLSLATTSGLGMLIIPLLIKEGLPHSHRGSGLGISDYVIIYFVAMIPAPALLMFWRKAFNRLPRALRVVAAILAALWTVLMLRLLYRS